MPGPEVPNVTWIPADPTNYRPRPQALARDGYSLIVIHITSGRADPMSVAEMWQESNHGTSAHFVIGQDGSILQTVPLLMAAQHAHNANAYSVGIEHCAREPNESSFPIGDPGLPPSETQYEASARLVAYLLKAAGLQPTRECIKGHYEADPKTTHTGCPDSVWDWSHYMLLVVAAYNALDTNNTGAGVT